MSDLTYLYMVVSKEQDCFETWTNFNKSGCTKANHDDASFSDAFNLKF